MNKEVLVAVSGMHTSAAGEDDRIVTRYPGTYRFSSGIHYVKYTETDTTQAPGAPAQTEPTRTDVLLKIGEKSLEVTRKGIVTTHMEFVDSRDSHTDYQTPFGMMRIDVFAVTVKAVIEGERICVRAGYSLESGGEKLSDAVIDITVENA